MNLLVIGNAFDVVKSIVENSAAKLVYVITHNSEIRAFCVRAKIQVFSLQDFRARLAADDLECTNFDLGICCNFEILPEEIFNLPNFGSVNIHPASLPLFGGRFPYPMLIENQLSYSEVCIHKINSKPDSGRVLARKHYPISIGDYYLDWLRVVSGVSIQLILEFLSTDFRKSLMDRCPPMEESDFSLLAESRKPRRELFFNSKLSLYDAIRINSQLGGTSLLKDNGGEITIFVAEVINLEEPLCNFYQANVTSEDYFVLRSDTRDIVKVLSWSGTIADGQVLFRFKSDN